MCMNNEVGLHSTYTPFHGGAEVRRPRHPVPSWEHAE